MKHEKVNILLVDDQPAKLLSYELILKDLNENLIPAASATDALEILLKNDIAVVLVDVCMPDLDGFQLAGIIREHPRFRRTAIIFISAIHLTETDYLRGYEMGGVDYMPVPVVPELLRAKVRVFAELHRKTRQLEQLNQELESRVADRTAEVQASSERLRESERNRSLALAAGQMGSLEWDIGTGECICDAGQRRIFGIEPSGNALTVEDVRTLIKSDDFQNLETLVRAADQPTFQTEIQIARASGEVRTCLCAGAVTSARDGSSARVSIVMSDFTERKLAEERQSLLTREVDHRARNALAVVQAIVRLTKAGSQQAYMEAVEGRIQALALAHTLLSESRWQGADVKRLVADELAPYRGTDGGRVQTDGPTAFLSPEKSQNVALVLHELATNSAKHGALSAAEGTLAVRWSIEDGNLVLAWQESGGPPVRPPSSQGFGTKIMNASIKRQIGGNVVWDWRPSGLHCTLHIPLAGDLLPDALRPANLIHLPTGATKRILLAEDDAMIGMMMRELLSEHGMFVVGPCGSLEETMLAVEGDFDAAFLDVNLGPESVYPVAARLKERQIPFTFVTGYGRESLDSQFDGVPILQKPITRDGLEAQLASMLTAPLGGVIRRSVPAEGSQPSSFKIA